MRKNENALIEVINHFKKGFAATGGGSVVPDEHVEAMDEEDWQRIGEGQEARTQGQGVQGSKKDKK